MIRGALVVWLIATVAGGETKHDPTSSCVDNKCCDRQCGTYCEAASPRRVCHVDDVRCLGVGSACRRASCVGRSCATNACTVLPPRSHEANVSEGLARAERFRSFNFTARGAYHESAFVRAAWGAQEVLTCTCAACPLRGRTFVHVFKAGGTSINEQFMHACPESTCLAKLKTCFKVVRTSKRPALATTALAPPAVLEARTAPTALTFSLVRDPIERFVSAHAELIKRNKASPHGDWVPTDGISKLIASVRSHGFWDPHVRPQYTFLLHDDGTPLPLEYIGTMDTFSVAEDLAFGRESATHAVANARTVPCDSLARAADSAARGFDGSLESLSDGLVHLLCDLYSLDFEIFGFPLPRSCEGAVRAPNATSPTRPVQPVAAHGAKPFLTIQRPKSEAERKTGELLAVAIGSHVSAPIDLVLLERCVCAVSAVYPRARILVVDSTTTEPYASRVAALGQSHGVRVVGAGSVRVSQHNSSGYEYGVLAEALPWAFALDPPAQWFAFFQHSHTLLRPLPLDAMPCPFTSFQFFRQDLLRSKTSEVEEVRSIA